MTTFTCATWTHSNGVAEVVLTPTGKGHRMGPDYWAQMPELFAQLDAAEEVRVIILRSGGEHFSFGLDLESMAGELTQVANPASGAAGRVQLLAMIRKMQRANTAVAACRKPVICVVQGWCIGGGVDLITAADVRLCSSDARFSVREVKLAIVPDVGTLARLPSLVGQGVARELALTGDDLEASRALRIGLVNDVLPSPQALLESARAMAQRMAANSPLVVQGIKQVMNASSEQVAARSLETVALWNSAFLPSDDLREALTAFAQKRPPVFKGR